MYLHEVILYSYRTVYPGWSCRDQVSTGSAVTGNVSKFIGKNHPRTPKLEFVHQNSDIFKYLYHVYEVTKSHNIKKTS